MLIILKIINIYYILNKKKEKCRSVKSSRLMKYFEEYIKKFDMNNIMVKTKYFHSIRMMALAEELATNLNIFTEDIKSIDY